MAYGAVPSTNMLRHTASLYHFTPAQDADASADPAACYPSAFATGVRCLAQRTETDHAEDDAGRVTQVNRWSILFGGDPTLRLRDRADIYAGATLLHSVYVTGQINAGGRAAVWQVEAEEIL